MDFRILGPIEVVEDGQSLRLGGPRQRALLAYLILREGDVVQGSRLVDELWHEPPSGGIAAVHSHVSRLRRIVGDRIATVGTGYALRLDDGDVVDLLRFQQLLAEAGAAAKADERATVLRAADDLWHGTPFDGLDVPFVATETVALEELRIAAIEERVEAELEAGHDGDLVAELATLVTRHPLRERLRRQWILALYRSGRQADALEAYRETRRMFDEELGLELSPALAELERAILQHDPSLAAKRTPPRVAVATRRRRPAAVAALIAAATTVTVAGAATAVVVSGRSHHTTTIDAAAPIAVPTVPKTKPVARHVRRAPKRKPHHAVLVASAAPTVTIATTTVAAPAAPPQTTTSTPAQPPKRAVVAPKATTTTTTTTKAKPKTVPPPAPKTIADDFNGTSVDPLIWAQSAEGTGETMAVHDGHLEFAFPAGTTPDPGTGYYGGNVATQCRFPRDFDARVDFSLAQWPSANGVTVNLWAFMGPRPDPWSATRGSQEQESYGANTGTWINVTDSDVTGALRVARHDGQFAAYFLHNGRWVKIAGAANTGSASIGIGLVGAKSRSDAVVVDFDNFKVSGVHPLCPPGSPFG